jgi:hypothetical protein
VRSKNELIPVEVKANTNSSKSLATLIKSKNYSDIKHGIKLSACNIGETETTITFPYFCSFLLKKFINS